MSDRRFFLFAIVSNLMFIVPIISMKRWIVIDRVVIDVFYEDIEEWIFIVINCKIILFCEILSEF